MTRLLLTAAVALAFAPAALAQRELRLPPATDVKLDYVVPVPAAAATCAAVGDAAGWLAVGHHKNKRSGPHVSLFRLDPKTGRPTGAAVPLQLPKADALADRPNYPLALAFHPKLPLLYVWQDVAGHAKPKPHPADDPDAEGFDHLLVYAVDGDAPELLLALAHGHGYAIGAPAGSIALDAEAAKLYVPNVRVGGPKEVGEAAVGVVELDADGLPDVGDGATTSGKSGGPRDVKKIVAARAAIIATAKKTGKSVTSVGKVASPNASAFPNFPTGLGFVPVGRDVVLTVGAYGPVVWDEGNRRARFTCFNLHPQTNLPYVDRVVGHPTLPVFYVTTLNTDWLFRMEHADGQPTLLPQQAVLTGGRALSPPVVMGGRKQVAVGGLGRVHLVGLDAAGALTADHTAVVVPDPGVQALAYSAKHELLYVPVEKLK